MTQKIKIKQTCIIEAHTVTTAFLSLETHMGKMRDVIKLHARNDKGGNELVKDLSKRIRGIVERDNAVDELEAFIRTSHKQDIQKETVILPKAELMKLISKIQGL